LSGTDYNVNDDNRKTNIYTILKYFNKYKKEKKVEDFYEWLITNSQLITDISLFKKICNIFDLNKSKINSKDLENIQIKNGTIEKSTIKEILKTDGFIFPIK
jgi:CRISPR/Cas system-associated protein endoribonuclease Cas2